MKAVLYCRVSSATQEEKGTIKTQQEYAERYCKTNGIKLTAVYLDDGISGSIPIRDRPAGSRLLADAQAGKFDTLLIYNLSRLSRDTLNTLETIRTLHSQGVALKSISDGVVVDSSPMGQFVITQLAGLNQLMRDNIRIDSRRGAERCVREGRWVGGRAPFGYRVVAGRLAIDPEQGEIVKNIFRWYLCGQRVRGITARLNAAETKHPMDWSKPQSRPWYEATTSGILGNRSYTGAWEYRKRTDRRKVGGKTTFTVTTPEQRIAVSIPALISLEDFNRVQKILKENATFSKRNVKHFYLLRGLIFCAHCERRYVGLGSGRAPWKKNYYRCSSHVGATGRVPCEGRAVRADLLDAAVWTQCAEFIANPGRVFDELRLAMEARQTSQDDLRSEAAQMSDALQVRSKERARVINLTRRGFISDNEAERELSALQREVEQLERQRAEMLSQLAIAESAELKALTAESMLGLLAEKVSDLNDDARREIACVLVDRILIEKTAENKPLARVCYVFRSTREAVNSVEAALATSSARFAAT